MRSKGFLNDEVMENVNYVVIATKIKCERMELFVDRGRDFSLRQPLQRGCGILLTISSNRYQPLFPQKKEQTELEADR
jgi:hypothetical protein